jgi:hypothetical protein
MKLRDALVHVLPAIAGVVLSFAPAEAQSNDTGGRVRVWAGPVGRYVLDDNDPFTAPGFGTVELKVDGSTFGFGGDVEYKFNKWLGVDAALGYARFDVDFTTSIATGTFTDKFAVVPLLFALNVHVVNTEKVDFWVGPQIGYLMFPDSLSYPVTAGSTFTYDPTNTFSPKGFAFGTDISVSTGAAFNFAFRWQNGDGDDDGHLTVDPTFVTFGFTKKF